MLAVYQRSPPSLNGSTLRDNLLSGSPLGLGARQGAGAGPVGSLARRRGAAAGSHVRRLGAAAPRRPAGSHARLRKVVSVQPPLARTCAYVKLPRCSRNYLSTQDQLSILLYR